MTQIPIVHMASETTFLSAPTESTSMDFVFSQPCIRIGFTFDVALWEGRTRSVDHSNVMALISTAAEGIYVDNSLIAAHNCPLANDEEHLSTNADLRSRTYRGQLFVLPHNQVLNTYVYGRDFRARRSSHLIVLGRRFLQLCHLDWDGPNQRVMLYYVGNPTAY